MNSPSPHAIATAAGLPLSVAQSAALKSVTGERMTRGELGEWRRLAGVLLSKPPQGGSKRVCVLAGRQSGKTLHIGAPIVVSALLSRCEDKLAPGQRARVLLIAPTLQHLSQLVDGVCGILDKLGLTYSRTEREVQVTGTRTVAIATVADALAPRGGTATLALVDEACLLPSEVGADGRDEDVIGAVLPSLQVLDGRLVLISSPWAEAGLVYDTVQKHHGHPHGEWLVMRGESWRFNPTLTEAKCRADSPTQAFFDREYRALFGKADDSYIVGGRGAIAPCVDKGRLVNVPKPGVSYIIAVDAAYRTDRFVVAVLHRELRIRADGALSDVIVCDYLLAMTPQPGRPIDFARAVDEIVAVARKYHGAKALHVPRHSFWPLRDNYFGRSAPC